MFVASALLLCAPAPTLAAWPPANALLSTDLLTRTSVHAAPDGVGGAFVVWAETYRDTTDIYLQHFDASGTLAWDPGGVPVCTAINAQTDPAICPDGAGGAIVAWRDARSVTGDIYAQRISAKGFALWAADGVVVCDQAGNQNNPDLVGDGSGGAIVTWEDLRGGKEDIYAQRISGAGVALWTANGVALCTASSGQTGPRIVADGSGGGIVSWQDFRGTSLDIYARRVKYDGMPQWTADGVAVCIKTGNQDEVVLASDGVGGAIIAWRDLRGANYDIFAARVTNAGALPWTADGIAVCTATGAQELPAIVPDGAGGAVFAWRDERGADRDIYAQRISGAGATAWAANGIAVCTATANQSVPALALDGTGGVIAAWRDSRNGIADIYARRITLAGVPAGDPDGIAVCAATGNQASPVIVPDGIGGATVAWEDDREVESEPYARRLDSAGVPLGDADGVLLCGETPAQIVGGAVGDGGGGAIAAWQENFRDWQRVYVQRVDVNGVVSWTPSGVFVSTAGHQVTPSLASDGAGGAIVVWSDDHAGGHRVYAQRFDPGGSKMWTSNGVLVSSAGGAQTEPVCAAIGAGSVIVAWVDARISPTNLYAQRLNSSGTPQWDPPGGVPVCTQSGVESHLRMDTATGPSGGAWMTWVDHRNGNADIYANHLDPTGSALWGSGLPMCTAAGDQTRPEIALDGVGGFYVAWQDARGADLAVYVQRASASTGLSVWSLPDGKAAAPTTGDQTAPRIVSDGTVYVTWMDERLGPGVVDAYAQQMSGGAGRLWGTTGILLSQTGTVGESPALCLNGGALFTAWPEKGKLRAQRLDGSSGAPQWPAGGVVVAGVPVEEFNTLLVPSGASGAVAVWDDLRPFDTDAYAQLLGDTGPLAAPDAPREAALSLAPVAPNPIVADATFRFSVPRAGPVALEIFDTQGRRVKRIYDGWAEPQAYTVRWDGRGENGARLANGIYFARLRSGPASATRTFVKIR